MKVIVFAATKGGVGKTTLLYNTSMYAAKVLGRNVLMADLDPQKSLKEVWMRSKELANPRLASNITNVTEGVKLLASAGYDREYLFVDTPGSLLPVIRDAVAAADVVVLPTKPMPIDLYAQEDAINIVREAGKMEKIIFVLTQTEKRSGMTKEAQEYLSEHKRPIVNIPNRVEYGRASETGGAACLNSDDCKSEIKKMWGAIQDVLNASKLMEVQADVRKAH